MNGHTRTLRVKHTARLYTDLLGSDMYAPPEATWELVKNALDAIHRLRQTTKASNGHSVRIELVKNHTLCPRDMALLITDTGTGLTDVSLNRYLTVGSEDDDADTGLTDQKRIGRIAAFALMMRKYHKEGYWVMSSTSAHGSVMLMNVTPAGLAEQELTMRDIPRDDIHLAGRCPEGSFTMILIPHVVSTMRDEEKISKALEWHIPRYSTEDSIRIFVGANEVQPPALPKDLVIHWHAATNTANVYTGTVAEAFKSPLDLSPGPNDVVGFFGKTEVAAYRGVRFCDNVTRTSVASSLRMIADVPFPFGKSELGGDVFVPGDVIRKQNTDRSGFSPGYIASEEWRSLVQIFIDHYSKELAKLIGDDSVLRDDPLGKAMRMVLGLFKTLYGEPNKDVKIPDGVKPPPGFDGDEDGDDSPDRGDGPVKKPRPHHHPPKKKAEAQRFNYKGQTFVLTVSREEPNIAAKFYGPNLICLNTRDVMTITRLKNAPGALKLYVLSAIIRCIEKQVAENEMDPEACDLAVQDSLLKFYERLAE